MKRLGTAVVMLLLLAIALWQWQSHRHAAGTTTAQRGLKIVGGDGGGLPRARPAEEKLDDVALSHAESLAEANGVAVLLIARHGHLLLEHYSHDAVADDLLDGAGMTAAVLALAGGEAQQLSSRLWQPLNAHDAWLAGCCLRARYADWLAVGILLAQDGRFEGAEIAPAGLIAQLRSQGTALEAGSKASGTEPFAMRDVYYLHGAQRTRLWVSPALQLVVLQVAGAAGANGWDETQLFNQIVRAVTDRTEAAAATDLLHQLVPNH
jgi:hypothetical protein